MSCLFVSVSACNEEHGSTVGNSSEHSTRGNTGARGVDLAAAGSITRECTTVTTVVGCARGHSVLVAKRVAGASREAAIRQRPAVIHEVGQFVDSGDRVAGGVNVVVEAGGWHANLQLQGGVLVLGDHEHSKSRDPALVLSGVGGSKTVVDDFVLVDTDSLSNGRPQVRENCIAAAALGDEVPVETKVESDLSHEHVLRNLRRHALRRLDPVSDAAWHCTLGCCAQSRRCKGNAGRDHQRSSAVAGDWNQRLGRC